MKKGKRQSRISIRLSYDEEEKLAEVYRLSNSRGTLSTFARNILLGNIEHPFAALKNSHINDVKDHGPLTGPYDNMVFYHSMIIAAEYLKIQHDLEYAKVIKANKPAFGKILRQLRGYDFDDKEAVKVPLKNSR